MRVSEALAHAQAFAVRRRWWILGVLVLAQWLFVAREALHGSAHNGWLFQDGDDGPWYWTSAWTLTSLHVPPTAVGLGWPYLLAPLAAIFGPDMASGLPAIVALNVALLAPAAVVGMYLLGERIAGRLFGLWAAFLWVVLPGIALLLYRPKTRPSVIDSFLPTATGLNALSDFPSMVCAIFGAYFLFRALDHNRVQDGIFCGFVLGFLVLLKPANGPLLVAGAVVLTFTFRFRALLCAGLAMIPALVALTVWKRTGQGTIPILPAAPTASGPPPTGGVGSAPTSGGPTAQRPSHVIELYDRAVAGVHRYINFNWHHLGTNVNDLREVFWSLRLLEFVLVAGSIALIGRSRAKGALVICWFLGFALVKATNNLSSVTSTSLYRYLLPAWPAWVLMVASVVFLWPSGLAERARRRASDKARAHSSSPAPGTLIAAAAIALAAGPLALAVAASAVPKGTVAQQGVIGPIPIVDFGLAARPTGSNGILLTWGPIRTARANYVYRVFRNVSDGCSYATVGAPVCAFLSPAVTDTRSLTYEDHDVRGRAVYRVALVAGWSLEPTKSNALLLSKPVTVRAR
jgi:hypothetical protein